MPDCELCTKSGCYFLCAFLLIRKRGFHFCDGTFYHRAYYLFGEKRTQESGQFRIESGKDLGKFYFACACAEAFFRFTYEYVYYAAGIAFISCDKKGERRNQCRRDAAYRNDIVYEKIRIITSFISYSARR